MTCFNVIVNLYCKYLSDHFRHLLLKPFVCTFGYMGRPKKNPILSEEELIEKERRAYQHQCKVSLERGVTNRHKRIKLNYDSIKYDIGTMDRFSLQTMYITCVMSILWTNDNAALRRLRDDIGRTINDWLLGDQKLWDKKLRIYVFEMPETKSSYVGSFRNVNFDLHLKYIAEPISFKHSVDGLMPLVDVITDTIKKSCVDAGLVLAHRPSVAVAGMSLKEYVNGLADTPTSEPAEP